jgi:hypothetical protein
MEKEWQKLVKQLALEVQKEVDKEILEYLIKQIGA